MRERIVHAREYSTCHYSSLLHGFFLKRKKRKKKKKNNINNKNDKKKAAMSSGGGEEKVQASPQLQQFIAQEQAKAQVRLFMEIVYVSYCIILLL